MNFQPILRVVVCLALLAVCLASGTLPPVNGNNVSPAAGTLADGALPPGLTLRPDGLLAGVPTTPGTYQFTVRTTDAKGCTALHTYALTINAAPLTCVSAASFAGNTLAAESIVAAFGSEFANATQVAATQPLPTTLAGARIRVSDSLGVERFAPLFFVSSEQVNFQMPPGTAEGQAVVTLLRDRGIVAASNQRIELAAPGLFAANANGQGALTGLALRVKADGSQSFEPVTRFDDVQQRFVAAPIELGQATDRLFLILFGTGLRNRNSLGAVNVKIGNVNVDVLFAGPQGSFVGLDQLNVALPRSLAGRGEVDVNVTVEGAAANSLKVAIR